MPAALPTTAGGCWVDVLIPELGKGKDHSFVNVKQALLRVTGQVINPLRLKSPTLKMETPLRLRDETSSKEWSPLCLSLVCPTASPTGSYLMTER